MKYNEVKILNQNLCCLTHLSDREDMYRIEVAEKGLKNCKRLVGFYFKQKTKKKVSTASHTFWFYKTSSDRQDYRGQLQHPAENMA